MDIQNKLTEEDLKKAEYKEAVDTMNRELDYEQEDKYRGNDISIREMLDKASNVVKTIADKQDEDILPKTRDQITREQLRRVYDIQSGTVKLTCEPTDDYNIKDLIDTKYAEGHDMDDFEQITRDLHNIYLKKNHDYGNSFHEQFQEFGLTSAAIRLNDKMLRFKKLIKSESKVKDESIEDTLKDLANYAILTLMELRD